MCACARILDPPAPVQREEIRGPHIEFIQGPGLRSSFSKTAWGVLENEDRRPGILATKEGRKEARKEGRREGKMKVRREWIRKRL